MGHTDIIEELIKRGATIEAKNERNYTPLYITAMYDHTGAFKSLLKHGAMFDVVVDGWSPIHWAAQNGNMEIIQDLVDRGVSIDTPTNSGETIMTIATQNGHPETVRKLVEKGVKGN